MFIEACSSAAGTIENKLALRAIPSVLSAHLYLLKHRHDVGGRGLGGWGSGGLRVRGRNDLGFTPHLGWRGRTDPIWYNAVMTRDQVKAILDRVMSWPVARQVDVARIVEVMEEQDSSPLRMSDEDAAEVRRRLAEQNPKTISFAEFSERLRRRYGV